MEHLLKAVTALELNEWLKSTIPFLFSVPISNSGVSSKILLVLFFMVEREVSEWTINKQKPLSLEIPALHT